MCDIVCPPAGCIEVQTRSGPALAMADSSSTSSDEADRRYAPMPLAQYQIFWQFLRDVTPFEDGDLGLIVRFIYWAPLPLVVPPPRTRPVPGFWWGQAYDYELPANAPPFKAPPLHLRLFLYFLNTPIRNSYWCDG